MSKVLKVENGNYTVKVESGREIILDTARGATSGGKPAGTVVIRGSLEVEGATTTVESTDTFVQDNIITLNSGETGVGISALKNYQSGIEVDRGSAATARIVFDENINWTLGGNSGVGTWKLENTADGLIPLHTNGIKADGTLFVDVGNGVISVTNTNDYEKKVFTYNNSGVIEEAFAGAGVIVDDDHIPNAKAIQDFFVYSLNSLGTSIITDFDTVVAARDIDTTGNESQVNIRVDNLPTANFYTDRVEFESIGFLKNKITLLDSNEDLIIDAPGTGNVVIRDTLQLTETPGVDDVLLDPTVPSDGVKLYAKTEYTGNTGIYFVNKSNTRDELISKNRAVVYSMIF